MAKKQKSSTTGLTVALGAAALASAGAYLLYGSKSAKKNRQKVKSWVLKAKAEVLEQIENVKQLDTEEYKGLVDTVLARYKGVQGVAEREIKALATELKGHWGDLSKAATKKKPAAKRKK